MSKKFKKSKRKFLKRKKQLKAKGSVKKPAVTNPLKIIKNTNAETQQIFQPLKVIGTASSEYISPAQKPVSNFKKKVIKFLEELGILGKILEYFFITIGVLAIISAIIITIVYQKWGKDLPDVAQLKTSNFSETTVIYDREGNVLYNIFATENRKYVSLKDINQKVIDATISIEDKNFYSHFGFDPMGMLRAQLNNMNEENSLQGASTLTQQLAKNLYLSPEKSIDRKIKELILALEIEWYFSKDEILEMYFNKIPYGSNAYGIEAAAQTFFKKSSKDLNLVEASILAALPKAPSRYSPYGSNVKELLGYCKVEICNSPDDENYVWGRKDLVLQRMLEDGKITKEDFNQAWRDGFQIKFADLIRSIKAPHFVFYVRDYLEKKYGKETVENGGLEVVTTLDPNLQANAEKILTDNYDAHVKRYGGNNAAMVALDPQTGGVLAMVGSVNYWDTAIDGQVNVTTSLRQPGSTFKPLVYANAIENAGIGSGTILADYKTRFSDNYIPVNSDNNYLGKMSIRKAIAWSRNIPAIKAYYIGGEEPELLKFLNKVGVTSLQEYKDNYNSNPERHWDFSYGPAMAIGSGEVRLIDLAGAFAAFADNGKFNPVNPILEVRDRNGNILEKYEDRGVQVMRPETAFIINSILSDIYARPAGSWRNVLTIPGQNLACKTGTSNKKIGRANFPNNLLTIGYTPTILAATWVGNSDGKQLSIRAWGEFTAAPMNKAFLELALKDKPMVPYEVPADIIKVGSEFYPPNWNKKKVYDTFKPLELKDCTAEERAKDPVICKTEEQQKIDDAKKAADEAAKAEAARIEAEKAAADAAKNALENNSGNTTTVVVPPVSTPTITKP